MQQAMILSPEQSPYTPILPQGHALWGTLERLESVGGGLLQVAVSGQEYLVDDSLQEKLAVLMGRSMTICHVWSQWGCGAIP